MAQTVPTMSAGAIEIPNVPRGPLESAKPLQLVTDDLTPVAAGGKVTVGVFGWSLSLIIGARHLGSGHAFTLSLSPKRRQLPNHLTYIGNAASMSPTTPLVSAASAFSR